MIKNTVKEFKILLFQIYLQKNTYNIINSTRYVSDKSTKIALVT